MQVFQQLFFYRNVNFYSNRTLSNPSVFYEAIQHFFDGFPKSVGRLRCKKSTAVCSGVGRRGNYKGVWCYTLVAGLYL